MQHDPTRELLWMFVKRIVEEVFADETGASRLQQVGLFTLMYIMQGNPPFTAARTTEPTRPTPNQIHRQMQKLLDLNTGERKQTVNKHGRGRALELTIKHTKETERLLKAIGEAGSGRK